MLGRVLWREMVFGFVMVEGISLGVQVIVILESSLSS